MCRCTNWGSSPRGNLSVFSRVWDVFRGLHLLQQEASSMNGRRYTYCGYEDKQKSLRSDTDLGTQQYQFIHQGLCPLQRQVVSCHVQYQALGTAYGVGFKSNQTVVSYSQGNDASTASLVASFWADHYCDLVVFSFGSMDSTFWNYESRSSEKRLLSPFQLYFSKSCT